MPTDKSKTEVAAKNIAGQGVARGGQRLRAVTLKRLRSDVPTFIPGDKVVVKSKIKEGDKERIQAFEGTVVARKGSGVEETFTVRRVTAGVGVERIFPVHSPVLVGIERKVEGFVRRAKLGYIRKLDGKAARIQDRNLKLQAAHSASEKSGAASKK